VRDPTALDVCVRDAAATSPECGGARREFADVGHGRRSRPPIRPRAGAKRCGGACARDKGVYGGNCASPAAGTARGQSGHSGELVDALLCTIGRENGRGKLLTVQRSGGVSSKVKKMQRRRSLATAAGRATLRCGRGAAPTGSGVENLQPIELDEPLVNPKRRKEGRRGLSFTGGDNCTAAAGTRGGGAGELGLEQASGCAGKAKGGVGVRARA
jgi:hypothetical protein